MWLTLSKALAKSNTQISVWRPDCMLFAMSFTKSINWVSQERRARKPCWSGYKMLCILEVNTCVCNLTLQGRLQKTTTTTTTIDEWVRYCGHWCQSFSWAYGVNKVIMYVCYLFIAKIVNISDVIDDNRRYDNAIIVVKHRLVWSFTHFFVVLCTYLRWMRICVPAAIFFIFIFTRVMRVRSSSVNSQGPRLNLKAWTKVRTESEL